MVTVLGGGIVTTHKVSTVKSGEIKISLERSVVKSLLKITYKG